MAEGGGRHPHSHKADGRYYYYFYVELLRPNTIRLVLVGSRQGNESSNDKVKWSKQTQQLKTEIYIFMTHHLLQVELLALTSFKVRRKESGHWTLIKEENKNYLLHNQRSFLFL